MTLWTPTKQPRNGRLLNPRLSSDTAVEPVLSGCSRGGRCIMYTTLGLRKSQEWVVEGDEGGDEEPNEYDIVTIRANAVSLAPSLFAR